MEKIFKLCYIDPDNNKAWFTDNFENQWGDDWNDAPYEHNAGEPYDHWGELMNYEFKDHTIEHKVLYFETNDWSARTPRYGMENSIYSVEDINKGKIPWLSTDNYNCYAGMEYEDFIKTIEDNGGTIYVPHIKE